MEFEALQCLVHAKWKLWCTRSGIAKLIIFAAQAMFWTSLFQRQGSSRSLLTYNYAAILYNYTCMLNTNEQGQIVTINNKSFEGETFTTIIVWKAFTVH